MRLEFRAARSVRSTRYAVICADLIANVRCPARATVPEILETLPDALGGIRFRREVKQALVGFGILHDRRVVAEGGHELDVFGGVHTTSLNE
jgi:hypothetical protein